MMPQVRTTSVEGPTPEQKRKIAEGITNVLIDDGRAKRENIPVAFHDVAATNYTQAP
jgi:phenylpyruvate tautomerase PptA (4-oxalocrotonate tautomerase family)